ncbi:MAG: carboxypeptidase-like regulatory domain-containing protein [Gammaproteobacteria bacterium]|jgi:hypothetical protein
MVRNPVILLSILAALASSSACGGLFGYRGEAIEGRVIDAATKQPLAGVIVVARWNLVDVLHGGDYGNLHLEETVTAADGSYRFAAWGPRWGSLWAMHDDRSPWLYFFWQGYQRYSANNVDESYKPGPLSNPRQSRWNGVVVELRQLADPEIDARVSIRAFETILTGDDGCAWQKVPRLAALALRHPDPQIRAKLPTLDWLWRGEPSLQQIKSPDRDPEGHKRCADPRIVLKEFL